MYTYTHGYGLEHLEMAREMEMAGDGGLGHLYYGALYYVYV